MRGRSRHWVQRRPWPAEWQLSTLARCTWCFRRPWNSVHDLPAPKTPQVSAWAADPFLWKMGLVQEERKRGLDPKTSGRWFVKWCHMKEAGSCTVAFSWDFPILILYITRSVRIWILSLPMKNYRKVLHFTQRQGLGQSTMLYLWIFSQFPSSFHWGAGKWFISSVILSALEENPWSDVESRSRCHRPVC